MTPEQLQALIDFVLSRKSTSPNHKQETLHALCEAFGCAIGDFGNVTALPPYQCPRCSTTRAPWEKECLGCGDTAEEAAEWEVVKYTLWHVRNQAGEYFCKPCKPDLDRRKARRFHTEAAAKDVARLLNNGVLKPC